MSTEAPPIERIFRELQTLPPEERLRLVGRIVDSLLPPPSPRPHRPLVYLVTKDTQLLASHAVATAW